MNLQQKMRRLQGYNTRGAYKPSYFLLHKEDVRFIRDLVFKEYEESGRKQPTIEQLTFGGTLIVESPLAKKGMPLVVMSEPNEVER